MRDVFPPGRAKPDAPAPPPPPPPTRPHPVRGVIAGILIGLVMCLSTVSVLQGRLEPRGVTLNAGHNEFDT